MSTGTSDGEEADAGELRDHAARARRREQVGQQHDHERAGEDDLRRERVEVDLGALEGLLEEGGEHELGAHRLEGLAHRGEHGVGDLEDEVRVDAEHEDRARASAARRSTR